MVTKIPLDIQVDANELYKIKEVKVDDITSVVSIIYINSNKVEAVEVKRPSWWDRLFGRDMEYMIAVEQEKLEKFLEEEKQKYIEFRMYHHKQAEWRKKINEKLEEATRVANEQLARKQKREREALLAMGETGSNKEVIANAGSGAVFYREAPPTTHNGRFGNRHEYRPPHKRRETFKPSIPSHNSSYYNSQKRSNNGYDPNSPIYEDYNDYNRNNDSGSIFGRSSNDDTCGRHDTNTGGGSSFDCSSPGGDD